MDCGRVKNENLIFTGVLPCLAAWVYCWLLQFVSRVEMENSVVYRHRSLRCRHYIIDIPIRLVFQDLVKFSATLFHPSA